MELLTTAGYRGIIAITRDRRVLMSLPDLTEEGFLPPGIHAVPLLEVLARFGTGSGARERQAERLRQVVAAAIIYPTIKRVLLWGSFVTRAPEPNDLDYSIVVSVAHHETPLMAEHRRFFVLFEARMHYGVDRGYLVIADYPLDGYIERLDFLCRNRDGRVCGVAEI